MEVQVGLRLCVIVCLLVLQRVHSSPLTLVYLINEDCQPGTILANVKTELLRAVQYSSAVADQLRFVVLTTQSDARRHFHVNASTGVVRAASSLDRDGICPSAVDCHLNIDLAVQPAAYFQLIKVTFELVDLNDNAPQFATERIRVYVSEGSLPGASISLQPAQDMDSPDNGVVDYQLVDDMAGAAPFDLSVERTTDGSHDVRLVLQSPGLDREVCDRYSLTVIARDAGTPPRSAVLEVDVVVTDINDHRPVMERTVYDAEVTENVDPSTYSPALVTVRATDADLGTNGRVRYRLSSRSDAQYGHLFGVDATTGVITLLQPVDYEALPRGGLVVLDVEAHDQTNSSPATATVRVRVQDVNDNAPVISVQSQTGDEDIFHVVENCVNGTPVAHVTVTDADTGDGGRVDCRLLHRNGSEVRELRLVTNYDNDMTLMTSGLIDREQSPILRLLVVCEDAGQPALTSVQSVVIMVDDANDHAPLFTQSVYNVSVVENQPAPLVIATVSATDVDNAENAQVEYELMPEARQLFTLDAHT